MIATFAASLHRSGAPAHVVESLVLDLLEAYGCAGSVVASPTAIWLEVGDRTRVLRLQPGESDLERLTELYAWHERVCTSADARRTARDDLARILDRPARWSLRSEGIAFVIATSSAGWLLGGSAADLVGGAVGGLLVWATLGVAAPAWRPLLMVVVGVLGGIVGALAGLVGASPASVALASIIVVVPGLGMTIAVAEVAEGHWSSGSARLLGAFGSAAQLAAGLVVGAALTSGLVPAPHAASLPGAFVAVPLLAPLAFAVLLRARPDQIPVVTLVSALGFAVSSHLGGPAGAGVAALGVGLVANLLARVRGTPALATSVPGILLLVPGSVGVRSIGQLLDNDALAGTQTAADALAAAGALALGLITAHALLPARRRVPTGDQDPRSASSTGAMSRSLAASNASRTAGSPLASSGGPHSRSSDAVPYRATTRASTPAAPALRSAASTSPRHLGSSSGHSSAPARASTSSTVRPVLSGLISVPRS
ncbi:MAG: threonine/serine exporter family protein [Myxococcota bacterium]